jgi:hypothetical protein
MGVGGMSVFLDVTFVMSFCARYAALKVKTGNNFVSFLVKNRSIDPQRAVF